MKESLSRPKIVIISGVLVLACIIAGISLANRLGPFKSSDVLDAASGYGMRSLTFEEYQRRNDAGSFNTEEWENLFKSPTYFHTKDASQANQAYAKYYELEITDVPGLEEFAELAAPKAGFDLTFMKMTSKESARKTYDRWSQYWMEDEDTKGYSGKKGGYTYTVAYYPASEGYRYFGMYLKKDTFIYIDSLVTDDSDLKCLEYFCKKLHLVSPVTSKK